MNQNTATREEILRWIVDNASTDNLAAWAEGHLARAYSMQELRDMVAEIAECGEVRR